MISILKQKLNKKKGFTLAELLVVVAIIGVLVAIMIPVFGTAMDKAKHAADLSEVRAQYAEKLIEAMTADSFGKEGKTEVTVALTVPENGSAVTFDKQTVTVTYTGTGGSKYIGSFKVDSEVTVTVPS